MTTLSRNLACANLIIITCVLTLMGFWYFIDGTYINKPITFYNDQDNIQVDKDIYASDSEIRIQSAFCKHRNAPGVTQWVLVDTIMRFYPPNEPTNLPIGCYGVQNGQWDGTWSHAVYLPPDLPSDTYYLTGTRVVKINPIKSITLEYRTEEFIVQ